MLRTIPSFPTNLPAVPCYSRKDGPAAHTSTYDMHISEHQNAHFFTKCSKMTEEASHKRYGMNGSVDSRLPKDEPPPHHHTHHHQQQHKTGGGGGSYGQGGRLKFFKDGKFILELERARDGERVSWVSVPRKTYWPPPGTATATPTSSYRQESSASLSVSDDNSSIQSSPWQRDHSWKQTTPTRNKSRGLSFLFWRAKKHRKVFKGRGVKRRRPLSTVDVVTDDSSPRIKKERRIRRRLMSVVDRLLEKNVRTSTPPRSDAVVSPRKRFLREMEKEKNQSGAVRSPGNSGERNSYVPEDPTANSAQKRSRCRPSPASAPSAPSTPPSSIVKVEKMENSTPPPHYTRPRSNGIEEGTVVKPVVRNSSYSITSLLAEDNHNRTSSGTKRSPSHSPSQFSAVPSVSSPSTTRYCSPVSSEDRMYSESVDRLRSIELSHAEKNIYPPYPTPPPHHYGAYMYPFPPVPPYYYARSPYMMPTIYHHGTTPILPSSVAERYHHPGSTSHQPMTHSSHHSPPIQPLALSVRRESAPSVSWSGPERDGGGLGRDVLDHPSDMPLNLSKHSG